MNEKSNKEMGSQAELEKTTEEAEEVNPNLDKENSDQTSSPQASSISSIEDFECPDAKSNW